MKHMVVLLAFLAALAPTAALGVDFGFAVSLGEGVRFDDGTARRLPVSIEFLPSIQPIPWIKVDLGFLGTLEDLRHEGRDFLLRPGVRVTPPFLPVYLRVAVPLRTTHSFDWGFLVGAGASIGVSIISIFGEIDASFTEEGEWDRSVPLDFRLGVEVYF